MESNRQCCCIKFKCEIFISLFIIFLVLNSCSDSSERERIQKIVEEWCGKHIELPENMIDFLTGDTIDLTNADFIILTYVDNIGCTACNIKLPIWKNFLNSIDSITELDVKFLMVLSPSESVELQHIIKHEDFYYPLYLDNDNKISVENLFPEGIAFNTLLLDKNRNVSAIGSPLYSSEIADLYKGIISGQMVVSTKSKNSISVNNSRISLGNLRPGESISRNILFSNHGNDTIVIKKVITSCECTDLSLPQSYLYPNSDLNALLHFYADTIPGKFERTIHVYYSDFDYPTAITIFGNIIY